MKLPEGWPTEEMVNAARLGVKESKAMQKWSDEWFTKKFEAALAAAPTSPTQEALTDSYVQTVPDKCDRVVWRGNYYHLPITPTPPAQEDAPIYEIRLLPGEYWMHATKAVFDECSNSKEWDTRILYTRPDDKLRKAAEETYDWLCGHVGPDHPYVKKLRAALEKK